MTRKRPKLHELAAADPDATRAWLSYDGRVWQDVSGQMHGLDSTMPDGAAA